MGDFTSEYKDQDGRVTTRIDPVKSIDGIAGLVAYLIMGILFVVWKFIKYLFSPKAREHARKVKSAAKVASDTEAIATTGKVLRYFLNIIKVIFIYIFLPILIVFSIFFYSLKISEPTIRSEFTRAVNYSQIKELLTKDSFNTTFANNISKEEKIIDEYNSLLVVQLAAFLKNQNIIHIRNIKDEFNMLRGSPDSIEGFIALDKKIKDTNKNYPPLRLSVSILLDIIENLGSLDKGYSKKLASLIRENVSRDIVRSSYNEEIQNMLKKFNQISALKAYKIQELKYK